MFSRDGYISTATREIEKQAGTKRSLVSYHFKSKDEFWKTCMKTLFSRFKKAMHKKSKKECDEKNRSRLNFFISQFLLANASVPEVSQILTDEFRRESWRQQWLLDNYYKDFFWVITQIYLQERRRHQISNISLTQFYYLLIGTMSIHSQAITHKILTREDPNQGNQLIELSSILTNMLKTSVD